MQKSSDKFRGWIPMVLGPVDDGHWPHPESGGQGSWAHIRNILDIAITGEWAQRYVKLSDISSQLIAGGPIEILIKVKTKIDPQRLLEHGIEIRYLDDYRPPELTIIALQNPLV